TWRGSISLPQDPSRIPRSFRRSPGRFRGVPSATTWPYNCPRPVASFSMAAMPGQITARQFHAAHGVEDWRVPYHVVAAHFGTSPPTQAVALASDISRLTGSSRDASLDLRHDGVTVSLATRDIRLARQISAAARELGLTADPAAVQVVNVTIDALVLA